jgi:hypothetical protein
VENLLLPSNGKYSYFSRFGELHKLKNTINKISHAKNNIRMDII